MVRLRGLEPPLLAKQRPQHCVSTNSTIAAYYNTTLLILLIQEKFDFCLTCHFLKKISFLLYFYNLYMMS